MDLELYKSLLAGGSGQFPLPKRALWKLTGNDRVRYLNGQITNDVTKLKPGHSLYSAVLSAKGRMLGDVFVSATEEALWIDATFELHETLDARLQKYLIADDAELIDVTEEWLGLHIIAKALPEPTLTRIVRSFENPRFGLRGFDIWVPPSTTLDSNGASPISEDMIETLRLEHGLAKWGVDMNEETLPPEAGLDRHGISYTKGCYLGQETIARIKSIGHVNKMLRVLRSDTDQIATPGSELIAEGKPVGKVTSAGFSPTLQKGIALGYVQRQHANIGTTLTAGAFGVTIIEPPLQLANS